MNDWLSWLFPRYCLGCKTIGSSLCPACLRQLPPTSSLPDHTYSLFSYRHPLVKKIIRHLKKYRDTDLAIKLGHEIADQFLSEIDELELTGYWHNPIVLPVPLHASRKRRRGFNQAALLAKPFAKSLDLDYCSRALVRTKSGEYKQALTQNRGERFKNIKNTFSVSQPDILSNRTVIIIDDVTTTGATLEEIRRVIKNQSSCQNILSLTLAH